MFARFYFAALKLRLGKAAIRLWRWMPLIACFCIVVPHSGKAESAIFGGGPFYSGGTPVMNTLRSSGFTTVILWCIHVDSANGDLIFNDQRIISNGIYVGHSAWPSQLATLKTPPTSVQRIEVSVGSWGVDDFGAIRTLMARDGTNTSSVLYRNFHTLKNITGADAIDFDDETLYDVPTTVQFGRMLASIGYKVTLCPYNNPLFWQSVYQQLGGGIVDGIYLQCYAGGAGNNPATWNSYFNPLKVSPGLWCANGSGCASGDDPGVVASKMRVWRDSAGVPGGFMWLYDDMQACSAYWSVASYARAINQAVDPLQISPSEGFSGIVSQNSQYLPAATPFILTNSSATPLNWNATSASDWLNVSLTSGTLAPFSSATVTVSLVAQSATNLPPGRYTTSIWFTNLTTGIGWPRAFSLNTTIANWPIEVTGFNAALIATNAPVGAALGATAFDIPNNYSFYQAGLAGGSRGLPLNGSFSSLCNAETAFKLASYGQLNALQLGYNHPKTATLTLAAPQAFSSLAVLATSANGGGMGTLILNFFDGSKSPTLRFNAQDWFYTVTNVALQGFGRLKLGANWVAEDNGTSNPNLYQTTLNLAVLGLARPISSITFSEPPNSGTYQSTAIFALSGLPAESAVAPPLNVSAVPGTNGTVRLNWTASAGATGYHIKRSLIKGGAYTDLAQVNVAPSQENVLAYEDTALANGTTYYYVLSALGTAGPGPNSMEVEAMPGSYRAWTLAFNPVAYWSLQETSGTVAHDLVATNSGLHSGNITLGTPGPIGDGFGTPHRAIRYNGLTGSTELPRVVGNTSFTLSLWLQTTATGGTPYWYNGKGLVDGEVGGSANDFGLALVGTKAGFGVGNPDMTLTSVKRINDGLWHHLVATRDIASGSLRIYIDGTLDAAGTGPTGARTAAPKLKLGSIQTATSSGFLTGSISEMAAFGRVLTPNEINKLYRAGAGVFYGTTLTNTSNGTNLTLRWPGGGKLLQAPDPSGPWTTINAVSPVTVIPNESRKFYRIQVE